MTDSRRDDFQRHLACGNAFSSFRQNFTPLQQQHYSAQFGNFGNQQFRSMTQFPPSTAMMPMHSMNMQSNEMIPDSMFPRLSCSLAFLFTL
jgi:hypothetical protein